mmetsp:Transcript_236/g.549  ORF Transcript_236/g.549 Transcript_236/m.549 type:complete len:259 (+) Transcript_236:815-1591(+)
MLSRISKQTAYANSGAPVKAHWLLTSSRRAPAGPADSGQTRRVTTVSVMSVVIQAPASQEGLCSGCTHAAPCRVSRARADECRHAMTCSPGCALSGHGRQGRHLIRGEGEGVKFQVCLRKACHCSRACCQHHVLLDDPPQCNLRCGFAVGSSNLQEPRVAQVHVAKGRKGFVGDSQGLPVGARGVVVIPHRHSALVHGWLWAAELHHSVNVGARKVAHTDGPREAGVKRLLQAKPGLLRVLLGLARLMQKHEIHIGDT